MHIVFITSEYPKKGFPHGGVGTVVQNIARGLSKYNHKVSIVGLNYEKKDEVDFDDNIIVYRISPKNIKYLTWFLNFNKINQKLKEIHAKQPIDVVETTELGMAFIKKNTNIQYLIRLNGGHHFFAESENRKINTWKAFQEKLSFKKADHVIGVSKYVVKHTSKYINFKDKFKGVIYNLANLERFKSADYSKEVKGRVFFAGSLCEKKGIRQLVKAMPKVISKAPDAHLIVAGRDTIISGTNQSYLNYLKSEIDENIKDKISFLGVVDNNKLSNEIEMSQVCVYPSHMEAMPLAWLEVLSMGKPFIASNLGPGKEVVHHKKTGLLCNPFNIEELSKKIIYLLKNRDYAHQLGTNAIKDIDERFGYNILMEQNIKLYKSIIKS